MTAFRYTYKNHQGLAAIAEWHMTLYGKHIDRKRIWMFAWAHCYVNNLPLPDMPKEGKSQRTWRAASARIETMKLLIGQNK